MLESKVLNHFRFLLELCSDFRACWGCSMTMMFHAEIAKFLSQGDGLLAERNEK